MDNDEYLSSKFNELLEKQKSLQRTVENQEEEEEEEEQVEEEPVWQFITSTATKNGKSKVPKTSSTSKNGWEEIQRCEEEGTEWCNLGRTEKEAGHCGQKVGNGAKSTTSANGKKTGGKKTPLGRKLTNEKKKQQQPIKSNRSKTTKPKPIANNKATNVPQSAKAPIRKSNKVAIQNKRNGGEGLSFFHCQVTVHMV